MENERLFELTVTNDEGDRESSRRVLCRPNDLYARIKAIEETDNVRIGNVYDESGARVVDLGLMVD